MAEPFAVSGFGRRVYPADALVHFDVALAPGVPAVDVRVFYVRDDWRKDDLTSTSLGGGEPSFWQELAVTRNENRLRFCVVFHGEHQHAIRLVAGTAVQMEAFYSLEGKLAEYKAFKGNVHCHSTATGGTLPPGKCAAAMRQAGFDFFALTDHELFEPSLQARSEMAAYDCGMACYTGEEASTRPGTPYSKLGTGVNHVLSIGAARGVMESLYASPDAYESQAGAIAEAKPFASLPEPERSLASRVELTCRAIHEAGGMAVYCHPFWMKAGRFYAPPEETAFLLRHGSFDALEIGNFVPQRTATMNSLVLELAQQGVTPPPFVGASDWHGLEKGWAPDHSYTIFLGADSSLESFRGALKERRTVAVGGRLEDFALGSYRLVKYAYFLMEHYYAPTHDPLCRAQGGIILQSMQDGVDRTAEIADLRKQLEDAERLFFG